mmetsp:Transcript_7792/g.14729  ORF Transcript_7792/g.14729 Transcript_7792/m.14729 type:complete len:413 (-) Transcript_7792:107-1345(-)|eukprot:CAMPEP_0114256820 /NCGR_PEP_ID=MMETSP0058-20121206/18383_1 /TAXON_ID=36894 /ORGANISM="Pyramimonas parkeae, CCMP726" /LENGTH=412 /DNA_ID=CAMNT_0001371465 /DNA_START=160 /DNA_END=1398 /DNA_ORIENTATION=-
MQITITTVDDRIVSLDLEESETIENLKAILEVETTMPIQQQRLLFNGKDLLNGADTLASAGVKNGDLLILVPAQQQSQSGAASAAASSPPAALHQNPDGSAVDPVAFQTAMRANADMMARLSASVPPLAEAILGEDVDTMQRMLKQLHAGQTAERARQEELARLQFADPMDMDAQRRIAELIEQSNINENYENAMEHTPESFGRVQMLYVDMEVNGVPLKAFVDSGAQSTIMSAQCAARCNIMRLVDKRFHGVAKGVGTSKIIGRVHQAPLKVGGAFLTASITVLEQDDMEFLFGLDMLKRHQCCIDLMSNTLKIGSASSEVPFLSEGDLPLHLRGIEPASESELPANIPTSSSGPVETAPPAAGDSIAAESSDMEAKVTQLVGLGFAREQAMAALQATNGSVDLAASMLFS